MGLDIKLIRQTFELAKPIADQVAVKFYEILFANHPEGRPLFAKTDFDQQRKLLVRSLVYIVDHLDQPEALEKYLHAMGGRHVDYGTEDEHYEWVGQALLQTFAFFFGDKWTPDIAQEWANAYGIIADVMKEGAAKKKAGNVVRLPGTANVQISDVLPKQVKQQIRDAVRAAIQAAITDEIRKAVDEELKSFGPDSVIAALRRAS